MSVNHFCSTSRYRKHRRRLTLEIWSTTKAVICTVLMYFYDNDSVRGTTIRILYDANGKFLTLVGAVDATFLTLAIIMQY